MPRVRLYLDVDGVLNVLPPPGAPRTSNPWGDLAVHRQVPSHAGAFDLRLSIAMVAAIAALDADVAWLTTWREDAAAQVAPLVEAPDWPWLDWHVAKTEAVVDDQRTTGPRPFVWVDDVAATSTDLRTIATRLDGELPANLAIRPSPTSGLLPSHLDRIRAFVAEHRDDPER